jgi:hypothetical protein
MSANYVSRGTAVDWTVLLEELRLTKLTFRDIAKATDVSHVNLINYSNQANTPLHANGERIIGFWCATTGKTRDQLPMVYLVKRLTSKCA